MERLLCRCAALSCSLALRLDGEGGTVHDGEARQNSHQVRAQENGFRQQQPDTWSRPEEPTKQYNDGVWHFWQVEAGPQHATAKDLQAQAAAFLAEHLTEAMPEDGEKVDADFVNRAVGWLSQSAVQRTHWAFPRTCQEQLGLLLQGLKDSCEASLRKKVFNFVLKRQLLAEKCNRSAQDVFLRGRYLQTQNTDSEMLFSESSAESWRFMQLWLKELTTAGTRALLWAGFWEAEPTGRATKSKLLHFAELTDYQPIHPTTELGRLTFESGELSKCRGKSSRENLTSELVDNFWSIASVFFVLAMQQKDQGSVVALVNKEMEGDRPLKDSVLAQYEIPTIGMAAWNYGWSPQIILVDLRGTCNETSPFLRQRLVSGLGLSWETWRRARRKHFRTEDLAKSSSPSWTCIDCGADSGCELDEKLSGLVRDLVEARRLQNENGEKLRNSARRGDLEEADRRLAIGGATAPEVDFRGRDHVRGAWTPLHFAASRGDRAMTQLLLYHDADPNRKDMYGRTPLHCSAMEGHAEVARWLMAYSADPHLEDATGQTPLQRAKGDAVKGVLPPWK